MHATTSKIPVTYGDSEGFAAFRRGKAGHKEEIVIPGGGPLGKELMPKTPEIFLGGQGQARRARGGATVQEGVAAVPRAKERGATVPTAGGGAAVQQPEEEEVLPTPTVRKERRDGFLWWRSRGDQIHHSPNLHPCAPFRRQRVSSLGPCSQTPQRRV
ncbi:UNVERIFIED_CONTAM: hypothetical protein FKN15_054306 [Acipenser sinensis]